MTIFPPGARDAVLDALSVAADGGFPGNVKPMKGIGSGVFTRLHLPYKGDAWRTFYTVQFRDAIWVLPCAFPEEIVKSGIKTPQADIDLIRKRFLSD